jgi:hypothetical protein
VLKGGAINLKMSDSRKKKVGRNSKVNTYHKNSLTLTFIYMYERGLFISSFVLQFMALEIKKREAVRVSKILHVYFLDINKYKKT